MSLKLLKNKNWDEINKNILEEEKEEKYIYFERWCIQNEDKPVIASEGVKKNEP